MAARVLVAGRWEGSAPGDAAHALALVGEGLVDTAPGTRVGTQPFGAGEAFVEALAAAPAHHLAPVVVGVEEETTRDVGAEVLDALSRGATPVVEGGHNIDVDAGLGLLEVISGCVVDRGADLVSSARAALEVARGRLAGCDVIAAASTSRPLLGLSSVVATGVDLAPRGSQDREHTAALARFFAAAGDAHPTLTLVGAAVEEGRAPAPGDPSRLPGSGAAGGAAAMVAALGGRIVPTGTLLAQVTHLEELCAQCDLVVVLEPMLHSPHLADALLDSLTAAAARCALPVVAVGRESSLSAHEAAQWGLHGVITVGAGDEELHRAGSRIARTWLGTHR